jgi:Putative abortive phage resistance protein AbiGi, antitoxin
MLPSLKFLHSMRERNYLESALTDGLLLTGHKVKFLPSEKTVDIESLLNDVKPTLLAQLIKIGKPWDCLDEERQKTIFSGIGAISGSIPMLCLTEVPEGRSISFQQFSFGGYGLVIKRQWLEKNEADRVLYIGQNSPVSCHLFRILANLRVSSLFVDGTGQVLFNMSCFPAILDLLAYIEVRENLEEFEWRIVGKTGFMGGKRAKGKRLTIGLDDIEYILVQKSEDIDNLNQLIHSLAISQKSSKIPSILCQPNTIPA